MAGKLNFISKCIIATRTFMNRILEFLRNAPFKGTILVNKEVLADISWFINFAEEFNGLILLPKMPKLAFKMECDACLKGAGGYSTTQYIAEIFSEQFLSLNLHIAQLEAVNLIAVLINLAPKQAYKYDIQMDTDNLASQQVFESGAGKDRVLTACARFIWKFSAKENSIVNIKHKPGETLIISDALSRASFNVKCRKIATDYCVYHNLIRVRADHYNVYKLIMNCI